MEERETLDFNYTTDQAPQLIKVVGVGGGGGNAVSKMYSKGSIKGVSFLLCNTDRQALAKSEVPAKVVLGPTVTKGLGAGNKPERAAQAAEESQEEIAQMLGQGDTRMVFITAGMGGGTGTGAAPVIGRVAMESGLLTIGIVTIPFIFEGRRKITQALKGVKEIRKHVDALLVVNNQRLIDVYGNLPASKAFERADDTLRNAARGISDMVNGIGYINLDFADVETTLKMGGVAIINTGFGSGPNRLEKAIEDALHSPLLDNKRIFDAKRILINIYSSREHELTTSELQAVDEFTAKLNQEFENIWGYVQDYVPESDDPNRPDDTVAVTILASGFDFTSTIAPIEGNHSDDLAAYEEDKRKKEEEELMKNYYGSDPFVRRISKPLLLDLSELDDEDIIILLESKPALQRDLQPVEQLRAQRRASAQHFVQAERHTETTTVALPTSTLRDQAGSHEPEPQVISFD